MGSIQQMAGPGSLIPLHQGQPASEEIPLLFWLIELLHWIPGLPATWWFVLPSLLSFSALLLLTGGFADRALGRGRRLSMIILATSVAPWTAAQTVFPHLLFAVFLSAALISLWRFLQRGNGRWLDFAAIATGFALITGGAVILYVIATFLLLEWLRLGERPRGGPWGRAILISAGIVLVTAIPLGWAGGLDYLFDVLVAHALSPGGIDFAHQQPFWYYLGRLPLIFLPWSWLLLLALLRVPTCRTKAWIAFAVEWMIAVIVPFSLIGSKTMAAMLGCFVPAALLVTWLAVEAEETAWILLGLWGQRLLLVLMGLGGGLMMMAESRPSIVNRSGTLADLAALPHAHGLALTLVVAALLGILLLFIPPLRRNLFRGSVVTAAAFAAPLVWSAVTMMPLALFLQRLW